MGLRLFLLMATLVWNVITGRTILLSKGKIVNLTDLIDIHQRVRYLFLHFRLIFVFIFRLALFVFAFALLSIAVASLFFQSAAIEFEELFGVELGEFRDKVP